MRKIFIVTTSVCLLMFLIGCGNVAKSVADNNHAEKTTAPVVSPTSRPLTAEEVELQNLVQTVKKLSSSLTSADKGEEVKDTGDANVGIQSFSVMAVQADDGWLYETKVRTVNGIQETLRNRYKKLSNSPLIYERFTTVSSTEYAYNYHEKISYDNTGKATISNIGDDSKLICYDPPLEAKILSRTIAYTDLDNTEGLGGLVLQNGSAVGDMAVVQEKSGFNAQGIFKIQDKDAMRLTIKNSNEVTIEYIVGPKEEKYIYTLKNLPPDSNSTFTELVLIDGEYDGNVVFSNILTLYLRAAEGTKPVIKGNLILEWCGWGNGIQLQGLKFTANTGTPLNIKGGKVLIENCEFAQGAQMQSGTALLSIFYGAIPTLKNCNFLGTNKTLTGLYSESISESDIKINNTLFSNLKYGIHHTNGGQDKSLSRNTGITFDNCEKTIHGYYN